MRTAIALNTFIIWTALHTAVTLAQTEAFIGQPFGVGCIVFRVHCVTDFAE